MFYQWKGRDSDLNLCYIEAVVPPIPDMLAVNKSYTSSGDLSAIEIWNVTTPAERLTSLSWNTRPTRIALMGTVNFSPLADQGLEDGWQLREPTPKFWCGGGAYYTIEVACTSCRLEFLQIFSSPPLGACFAYFMDYL